MCPLLFLKEVEGDMCHLLFLKEAENDTWQRGEKEGQAMWRHLRQHEKGRSSGSAPPMRRFELLNSSFSEESRKWHMASAFSEEMRAWHVSSAGDTLQMAPPQRRQAYLFCKNLEVTHVSYFSEKSRKRHVSGYFSRRKERLTRVPCRRHSSNGATSEETNSTFSRQDNLWHLASPGSLWNDTWRRMDRVTHGR